MANIPYTPIAAADTDPESPLTASLLTALNTNVEAAFWGNAPWQVRGAAIEDGAVTETKLGAASVSQSKLKTALQQASSGIGSMGVLFTGGTYTLGWGVTVSGAVAELRGYNLGGYSSAIAAVTAVGYPMYFQARYITASKPYNWGNGDFGLLCFALVDNVTGDIVAVDVAEDPVHFYNGPNRVDPRKIIEMEDGKKFFECCDLPPMPETEGPELDAYFEALRTKQTEMVELTDDIRNRDMNVLPHPFMGYDLTGKTVVLLEPTGSLNDRMMDLHEIENDDRVPDLIVNKKIILDTTPIAGMNTPPGVVPVRGRWKPAA